MREKLRLKIIIGAFTCKASDGFIRCAKSFVVRTFVCYEAKQAFASAYINGRRRDTAAKFSNKLSFRSCSSSNF